jgi:hypothetical protein
VGSGGGVRWDSMSEEEIRECDHCGEVNPCQYEQDPFERNLLKDLHICFNCGGETTPIKNILDLFLKHYTDKGFYVVKPGRVCILCNIVYYTSGSGRFWFTTNCRGCRRTFSSRFVRYIENHQGPVCPDCMGKFKQTVNYYDGKKNKWPEREAVILTEDEKKRRKIQLNAATNTILGTTTCGVLKNHVDLLKDDPERLSTDFMKSLINKKRDPCPEIQDE